MKMQQLQTQLPRAADPFQVYVGTRRRHSTEVLTVRRSVILRDLVITEDGSMVLQRGEYVRVEDVA